MPANAKTVAAILCASVALMSMLPSGAYAAQQAMNPAQCLRLKSKAACESCMKKTCGARGCAGKTAPGNKSPQWGGCASSGI